MKVGLQDLNLKKIPLFVALILMVFFGLSYLSVTMGCKGGQITSGHTITILPGSQNGQYDSRDLSIRYQYKHEGDKLQISGTVTMKDSVTMSFRDMDQFHLKLILGDSQGKVLEMTGLITMSNYDTTDTVQFTRSIDLPPGTRVLAFGYEGAASSSSSGGGRGDGVSETLWEYPVTK